MLVIYSLISSLASAVQGDTVLRVKSGQNTALQCPCPQDETIIFLLWGKVDSPEYMLLERHSNKTYWNSSFKDRVELKDGDLTLILKAVTIRDTGMYECCVIFKDNSISGRKFTHVFNLTVTAAEQKNITAGKTVVLPCRAPNGNSKPNVGVSWSRADLDPRNVLLYLDNTTLPDEQHPAFKNRVDLQDRQMKDGDVSLILKDVTIDDAGTYECHVIQKGTNCRKRTNLDSNPICIISLRVAPPGLSGGLTEDGGEEDRSIRLVIGLCVFGVFVGVVWFLIHRRHAEQSQDPNEPPAEAAGLNKSRVSCSSSK